MSPEGESMLARLEAGDVLFGDGAMGTLLLDRGLEPGACPESLNLERPELLEDIARGYVMAGADIVSTNTFGGSPLKLAHYGLQDRCEEVNARGVAAARGAAGNSVRVAGVLGPTGCLLKPHGDTDPDEVYDGFVRQARAMADEGVDLFYVETMIDLTEATLATRAAKMVAPTLPVAACMTFDKTPRGYFTIMGVDIPTAARELAKAGADVVGSNCGNGIERLVEIAGRFRECTSLPLIAQANAGLPETEGTRVVYPDTPERMARGAVELIAAGTSIIGGCCGTTPAHVEAMKRAVRKG